MQHPLNSSTFFPLSFSDCFLSAFPILRFMQKSLYVLQGLFSFSSIVIETLAGNMTAQNKDAISQMSLQLDVVWLGSTQWIVTIGSEAVHGP